MDVGESERVRTGVEVSMSRQGEGVIGVSRGFVSELESRRVK